MTGLHTNVLARFFFQDDPQQNPMADQIIGSLTSGDPGWIPLATILELVWVLTSKNRLDRKGITKILIASSAKAAGCSRTVPFDRRAARDAGMQLIE